MPLPHSRSLRLAACAVAAFAPALYAQQPAVPSSSPDLARRLDSLEAENTELKRRMDALSGELESRSISDVIGGLGASAYGLGPAASKVYGVNQGLSIGGYGEFLYENYAGDAKSDQLDMLRSVLYFGYKFDEHWLLNTEIEYEHAVTGEEAEGEVAVEFAYLDYLWREEFNVRAGLVLMPLGLINELHEPIAFLGAKRPLTERLILPTTWRENGIGVFGDVGDFSYRAYLVNGLDASGFADNGLRDGRQQGSKALAEDFGLVARADWHGVAGLSVGVGAYHGDAGQDLEDAGGGVIDATTTLLEAHIDARWRGWRGRALIARGEVDDVDDLNAELGLTGAESIGEALNGHYLELGYDVMPLLCDEARQSLVSYVRWEELDTQSDVPSGFSSDPANDQEIWTFGVQWQPLDQIVVKLDYQDFDNGADSGLDQWNVLVGYVF